MPPWLISLESCPSTNTWAMERWAALAHGAVVWTEQQTAGRGRNGHAWQAPPGVLTASIILHHRSGFLGDAGAIALVAGLAVALACEDLVPGLQVDLKWPNDALVNHRKLAGILCERPDSGVVVVGIGLNIDPRWGDDHRALPVATQATSLAEHGPPPTALAVLTRLRRYLDEGAGLLDRKGLGPLLPGLEARDALFGRVCVVATGDGEIRGIGAGIDAQGRLLLKTGQTVTPIASGHITAW